jgi:hypothetical protein
VLWIGGPPGSGKTTIATRIARRHGLRWYGADTRTWLHRDRALHEGNPAAHRWEAMTPEERWAATPEDMLDMSVHRERGAMIVDDLREFPTSPLIVAEGSSVSPAGVIDRARAVWLIPSAEFQQDQLDQRQLGPGPTKLYRRLTAEIEREASQQGMPVLTVDHSSGIGETVNAVESLWADALAEGPRVETFTERRALLREANAAIVAQVRGYYARPWAKGDADAIVRTFLCECGDPACNLSVDLAVGTAAAARVLAAAHD